MHNSLYTFTVAATDTVTLQAGKTAAGTFTADAGETSKLTGGAAFSVAGGTSAQRSALVDQFNNLRTQINQAAQDAGFNGTNLLAGDSLTIAFNEKTGAAQSKLSVQGSALSADALGLGRFVDSATGQPGADFGVQNNADLGKAADALWVRAPAIHPARPPAYAPTAWKRTFPGSARGRRRPLAERRSSCHRLALHARRPHHLVQCLAGTKKNRRG